MNGGRVSMIGPWVRSNGLERTSKVPFFLPVKVIERRFNLETFARRDDHRALKVREAEDVLDEDWLHRY